MANAPLPIPPGVLEKAKAKLEGQRAKGEPERLGAKEAAPIVGYSHTTLAEWRRKGLGPPSYKAGNGKTNTVYYLLQDLLDFREKRLEFNAGATATPRGVPHVAVYFKRPHVVGFLHDHVDLLLDPDVQILVDTPEKILSRPWLNQKERQKALALVTDRYTALKIGVAHLKALRGLPKRFWSAADSYYTPEFRERIIKGKAIANAIKALEEEERYRLAQGHGHNSQTKKKG